MAQSVEERGWQVGKSLSKCLEHMLMHEISTDVIFTIVDQSSDTKSTTLKAHKLILCARSPVFEAMFSENFVEGHGEVTIPDAEPETFKQMIRYYFRLCCYISI